MVVYKLHLNHCDILIIQCFWVLLSQLINLKLWEHKENVIQGY